MDQISNLLFVPGRSRTGVRVEPGYPFGRALYVLEEQVQQFRAAARHDLGTGRFDGAVPTALLETRLPILASYPFKVQKSATAKVRVIFGQVNSITPTIGGTALDAASPPELTITTSGVVYLECSIDGSGNVTAVAVKNASSLPSASSSKAYITLATVTYSGGAVTAISQAVTTSLQCAKCGATTYYFGSV